MDIFVRNIPEHMTQKQLEWFFTGPLRSCGIEIFHAEKHHDKPTGVITVPEKNRALHFLSKYGLPQNAPRSMKPPLKLHYDGKLVMCHPGRHEPSDFSLRALHRDATERAKAVVANRPNCPMPDRNRELNRFDVQELRCGTWDYEGSKLFFTSHFTDNRPGKVIFGRKQAMIVMGQPGGDACRIDIDYRDCYDINLGTYQEPSVTFNLGTAPKIYLISAQDTLAAAMARLELGARKASPPKKIRLPAINEAHASVAGTCFVYRATLYDSRQLGSVRALLHNAKTSILSNKTYFRYAPHSYQNAFNLLTAKLNNLGAKKFGRKPFQLRYQVERLGRNGLLPPQKIIQLLPKISALHDTHGSDATVSALRRFARDLKADPPGPSSQHDYSIESLEMLLVQHIITYDSSAPDNPYELAKRHTHINLTHKIIVTPCGTYLEGPEPEPTNRVLRKYAKPDNFVRVVFQDEDGGSVRFDARTDQARIYHERFKSFLDSSIVICGQGFSFLGFSHSSLRAQSCWFMSTMFSKEGMMIFTDNVIKELGDFSRIRVPAKCAARIGQNFTDTNSTVKVHESEVGDLPMVVRNGRDFSDGVGTISRELLRSVWKVYGTRKQLKPTALQIRFQGAKGMVSLDPKLPGRQLMLRKNMRKYETAVNWDLEICGAAFRPLPMVLNRPFVKIFEDLGVPLRIFLELLKEATDRLRRMTDSPINTALFLEESDGIKATRLPALIRHLGHIGYDYHDDEFLYQVVEMAVVSKVRDIKYRGRIPVPGGVTLYGVMDEDGYLEEGQISVITEREGGKTVLVQKHVVVTRSPALHPGDVQVVEAVPVPPGSHADGLSNVVVFSQKGNRDLPSQLSGGDLDGDLFNVIWDPRLLPQHLSRAANYQSVGAQELDREVRRKDMSDFFVTFMESDLLGKISTDHLIIADQSPYGVFDERCIKLAEMASTAVDFSKTGIPVDMNNYPKFDRCRPDFMAPSPRVIISENGLLDVEEDDAEDDEAFEGLDVERRPFRYYYSDKALGHIYRAIDERQFLDSMQRGYGQNSLVAKPSSQSLLNRVLKYLKHWAQQYGVIYSHHKDLARDIRNRYEEVLSNILYDYEPAPNSPLSEAEVFSGQILGRTGGVQGKSLRELSQTMRERFEVVVDYTIMRIVKGDKLMRETNDLDELYEEEYTDREFEALPRAMACLDVAVNSRGLVDRRLGELKSFRYVAAGVCLRELERYRITTFGSLSGLPSAWDVAR